MQTATTLVYIIEEAYAFQIKINVRHIKLFRNMFHDIAWKSSWKRLIYRVHHTYINLFHDDCHAISCSTHMY